MKKDKRLKQSFSDADREAVYRAIRLRRDMRHFTSESIEPDVLQRLLEAFHQGPSVGLMQPWRIIRITNKELRHEISLLVDIERQKTAQLMDDRKDEFLQLKVEGIRECGELLVVSLADDRERHIFGRRTLPDMDLASVACAIQNMWLAARAENLGLGWVSLFEPSELATLLSIPDSAKPIAILCLGHVKEFYREPMLEMTNWTKGMPLEDILFENQWQTKGKD